MKITKKLGVINAAMSNLSCFKYHGYRICKDPAGDGWNILDDDGNVEDEGYLSWSDAKKAIDDWEDVAGACTIEAANVDTISGLQGKIYKAARNNMINQQGFPEDEVDEYLFVDTLEIGADKVNQYVKVEVRAEVSYEGMEALAEVLNPIVQMYDDDAYFDFDEPGIMSAYIQKYARKLESTTTVAATNQELPEIWTVYYYEDNPEVGFKVGSKEEAYALRDELGEDYEAELYSYGTLSDDNDDEDWIVDIDIPDSYTPSDGGGNFINSATIVSNSDDGELWYIDKQFRDDTFEEWLFDAYELRPREIRGEEDAYRKGYEIYLDACKYSEEQDKLNTSVKSAIDLKQYGDGYVELCDGEPTFIYDNYSDAKRGVSYSRMGDIQYGMGDHTYEIKLWKDGKLQPVEESQTVESANYGGAYDIDPESFWTKEDIIEFAYDVEERLNSMEDMQKYGLHFTDTYIVDYNRLVVDFEDEAGNSFASNTNIDMRKIRSPQDLIRKYAAVAATEVRNDVEDFYADQEVDWNYVDSSEKVEGGHDLPELPLDPPEYDQPHNDITWGDVTFEFSQHIRIDEDGNPYVPDEYLEEYVNYLEDEYETPMDEYSLNDVYLDDAQGVFEKFEDMLEQPNVKAQLPLYAGDYIIQGEAELIYDIEVSTWITYNKYEEDREEYSEIEDISFNKKKSSVNVEKIMNA